MTNVVIQQNSRKLLMMDVLMSETFWTHKKWNKIASNIKLVFYSLTITMMHVPINITSLLVLQPSTRIPFQPNHTETPTEARNTDATPTQQHRNSNTHRTKNNTTNVVIQQNSRKLLRMDILMSETCWAPKKWNNIASDIKLVFYSSTITMMHGPINIRFICWLLWSERYK